MSRDNFNGDTTENTPSSSTYGEDLYRPEFIIGYTGDLNNSPTVYFHDPATKRIGSITQHHRHPLNIGRGGILQYEREYRRTHVDSEHNSSQVLSESIDGFTFHYSRSAFVDVTSENREELAKAITRHKNIKSVDSMSRLRCLRRISSGEAVIESDMLHTERAMLRYERARVEEQQIPEPSIETPSDTVTTEDTTEIENANLETLKRLFTEGTQELEDLKVVERILEIDEDQNQLEVIKTTIDHKKIELNTIEERIITLGVEDQINKIDKSSLSKLIGAKQRNTEYLEYCLRNRETKSIDIAIAKKVITELNKIIDEKVDQFVSQSEEAILGEELDESNIEEINTDYGINNFTNTAKSLEEINATIKKLQDKNNTSKGNIKQTTNIRVENRERQSIKNRLSYIRELTAVRKQIEKSIEIKAILEQDLSNKSQEELIEFQSQLKEIGSKLEIKSLTPKLQELLVKQHKEVIENVERRIGTNLQEQFNSTKGELANLEAIKEVLAIDGSPQELEEINKQIKEKKAALSTIKKDIKILISTKLDRIEKYSLKELVTEREKNLRKLKEYRRNPEDNRVNSAIAQKIQDHLDQNISEKIDATISKMEAQQENEGLAKAVVEDLIKDVDGFTNITEVLKKLDDDIHRGERKNDKSKEKAKKGDLETLYSEFHIIQIRISDIRHSKAVKNQIERSIEIKKILEENLENKSPEELVAFQAQLREIGSELEKDSLTPKLQQLLVEQHKVVSESVEKRIENSNRQEIPSVSGNSTETATIPMIDATTYIAQEMNDYYRAHDLPANNTDITSINRGLQATLTKNNKRIIELVRLSEIHPSKEIEEEIESRTQISDVLTEKIELSKAILDKGNDYFNRLKVEGETPSSIISKGIYAVNKIDEISNRNNHAIESSPQALTQENSIKYLGMNLCKESIMQKVIGAFKNSNLEDIDVLRQIYKIKDPDNQLKIFMKYKNFDLNNPNDYRRAQQAINNAIHNGQIALSTDEILATNNLSKQIHKRIVNNSQQSKIDRLVHKVQKDIFGDFIPNENRNHQRNHQRENTNNRQRAGTTARYSRMR